MQGFDQIPNRTFWNHCDWLNTIDSFDWCLNTDVQIGGQENCLKNGGRQGMSIFMFMNRPSHVAVEMTEIYVVVVLELCVCVCFF
jgi:hypothetical protein